MSPIEPGQKVIFLMSNDSMKIVYVKLNETVQM